MTGDSAGGDTFAALRGFLRQLDGLVATTAPLPHIVAGVKERLADFIRDRPRFPAEVRSADGTSYARHLLYGDPEGRYEVVMMVWGPGQQTPVHDHSGIWCVEGVVEGVIDVTRFDITETIREDVVRMKTTEVIHAGLGQCGALIPPVEYHRIANPYRETALTMHVYGGRMRSCKVFEQRDDHAWNVRIRPLGFNSSGPALRAS